MVSRLPRFASATALALMLVCVSTGPALAADATLKQVYDTARSGDIDGALTMMAPVLKDHPTSAKAHYVEAELLARDNRLGDARTELARAKSLAPGLPGVSAHSVQELEAKLNGTPTYTTPGYASGTQAQPVVVEHRSGIPWGAIIIIALVLFGVLALMRRRSATVYEPPYAGGPGYGGGMPGPGYGGPGYGAPGYGAPGYGGGMGGGMGGGGIMGGLAQGAAMGAGFAVGEEVVDHMMGGHDRGGFGGGMGSGGYGEGERRVDPDADMGGNDFGVSDGGSWDDSSSGGGGGDDSW